MNGNFTECKVDVALHGFDRTHYQINDVYRFLSALFIMKVHTKNFHMRNYYVKSNKLHEY